MAGAADPKSVQVDKTGGTGVDIAWKDGHQSHYSFQFLRDACPCALCDDEREKTGRKPGTPPAAMPGAIPIFREPVRPTEVHPAGKYAITFTWNDGHQHGIYSWEYLREMCTCAECAAKAK
jgi:DUF971 family protein